MPSIFKLQKHLLLFLLNLLIINYIFFLFVAPYFQGNNLNELIIHIILYIVQMITAIVIFNFMRAKMNEQIIYPKYQNYKYLLLYLLGFIIISYIYARFVYLIFDIPEHLIIYENNNIVYNNNISANNFINKAFYTILYLIQLFVIAIPFAHCRQKIHNKSESKCFIKKYKYFFFLLLDLLITNYIYLIFVMPTLNTNNLSSLIVYITLYVIQISIAIIIYKFVKKTDKQLIITRKKQYIFLNVLYCIILTYVYFNFVHLVLFNRPEHIMMYENNRLIFDNNIPTPSIIKRIFYSCLFLSQFSLAGLVFDHIKNSEIETEQKKEIK